MDRKHILCKITFPAFQSLEGEEWGLEGASAVVPRGVDRGQLRPCAGPLTMPIPLDSTEISPHQPHPSIHTCDKEDARTRLNVLWEKVGECLSVIC
jgi:hypothetical protein